MIRQVKKQLSTNDLGLTGGHQAGIVVPRKIVNLNFFPHLDTEILNPRETIQVEIKGQIFNLNYIYYNSKLLGVGTRNEYRLTCLSKIYRELGCEVGDFLIFKYDEFEKKYTMELEKNDLESIDVNLNKPLIIRAGWYD